MKFARINVLDLLSLIVVAMVLAVLFGPTPALADTKTVTWNNAAKNVDDTNIPASGAGSLVRTTIEYGTCNAQKNAIATKSGEIFVAAPATSASLPLVVVQEFCLDAFHSNTYATTFAPCVSGAAGSATCPTGNSDRSNVVVTQSVPSKPKPPAAVAVGDLVAYGVTISKDRVAFIGVGRVAPGTQCDMSQNVNGRYLVPRGSVTWAGNVQPQAVFATCG